MLPPFRGHDMWDTGARTLTRPSPMAVTGFVAFFLAWSRPLVLFALAPTVLYYYSRHLGSGVLIAALLPHSC
jgi:hypothetical protein